MPDLQPLVGDVKTQFVSPPEELHRRIEDARVEQEAMCGYPLVLQGSRTVEMRDDKTGQLVIEVYATFAPAVDAPPAA